jgi:HEAT repeat protein
LPPRALDQLQPESIEAMFKALQHPDPDIRDTIARQLERHRDPDIRKRYADLVASLPPTATAATSEKTKPTPTGDSGAPKIARQVVPYYLTMLKSDQPEVRANAAAELGRSGPEAVKPLTEASADPEPSVRVAVARSLGSLGDPSALPVLVNLLRDPQPLVRAAAVRALGTFADPSTVDPLTRALSDADWHVRWEAADILGRLKNRSASPALQAALQDAHWYVRRAAAEALGKIGDPSAAAALGAAQADSHWYVRQTAAAALKALK